METDLRRGPSYYADVPWKRRDEGRRAGSTRLGPTIAALLLGGAFFGSGAITYDNDPETAINLMAIGAVLVSAIGLLCMIFPAKKR